MRLTMWRGIHLLVGTALLSLPGAAASGGEELSAHLAAAALAAFADTRAALQDVSEIETQAVSVEGRGPLDAYPLVNEQVGRLLESALLGIRHLAAAAAHAPLSAALGISPRELRDLATLEEQLLDIMAAQAEGPVFWWHGPKWMVSSKLQRAFHPELQERLSSAAAAAPSAKATAAAIAGDAVLAAAPGPLAEGQLPLRGLAVGEEQCGTSQGCEIAGWVAQLRSTDSTPVHIVILPSEESTLRSIGSAMRIVPAKGLFVTFALSPDSFVRGPQQAMAQVTQALRLLGRSSFDLVWLPLDACKKRMWKHTQQMLQALTQQKSIGAYGVHAAARNEAVAKKLLDRQPAPAAWLTPDDPLAPADAGAVAAARSLGVAVAALPRRAGEPSPAARLYVEAAARLAGAEPQAALLRWTLHRGLAAVLRPRSGSPLLPGLAGDAQPPVPLPPPALRLLGALATAGDHRHGTLSAEEEAAAGGSEGGARAALLRGRRALLAAKVDSAAQVAEDAVPVGDSRSAVADAVPSVSQETLGDLDLQAKTYKGNNHIIYRENFFDEGTWAAIVEETERLWKTKDMDPNCNLDGKNRLGGYVLDHAHRNTSLYRLIYGNEDFRRWVSAVNGDGEMFPSDFPIELREYGPKSKGMGCHPDLQMYAVDRKDTEFAITVSNDSPCKTWFYDPDNKEQSVVSKANSLFMVRANAATHCVGPTQGGTRIILKFIYVGDYRKSDQFWSYTGNSCGDENPNRRMMEQRRDPGFVQRGHHSLLEL